MTSTASPLLSAAELGTIAPIAVACEGVNLRATGKLCLVQLYFKGSQTTWLVDVVVLKEEAFNYVGESGISLRMILEDETRRKLFYDCRVDACALFAQYNLTLRDVFDVQLAVLALRQSTPGTTRPENLLGLKSALETYLPDTPAVEIKALGGKKLFRGTDFDVFGRRPLPTEMMEYAAADVALLFALLEKVGTTSKAVIKVRKESARRVEEGCAPGFNPRASGIGRARPQWGQ